MPLLASFRRIIDAAAATPTPLWEQPIAVARRNAEAGATFLRGDEPEPVGSVRDRTIAGAAGPIGARVYQPEGYGPHGVLVYFHGGGYAICSIDTHDALCRQLCNRGRCVVVSVDYRLAPEHPFPAGVEDAIAAMQWVQDNAAEVNGDRARVAVGGDSAGANFAAVAALVNRDDTRRPRLRGQLLLYPGTDRRGGYPSLDANGEGYLLSSAMRKWFGEMYVPAGADPSDWRLSPMCAASVDGVAPALVVTAEFDPLRDEGDAYATRMQAAGVDVTHHRVPGVIHGFLQYSTLVPEAMAELDRVGAHLCKALA
jgi:acetyl esterase